MFVNSTGTNYKPIEGTESTMFANSNTMTKYKPFEVNDSGEKAHFINYNIIEQSNPNVSTINNQLPQHFSCLEETTFMNTLNHFTSQDLEEDKLDIKKHDDDFLDDAEFSNKKEFEWEFVNYDVFC